MNATASLGLFTALITFAITGAAIAACVLLVMIIRDWRAGRLW